MLTKPDSVQQTVSCKLNSASLIGLLSEHGDTWFSDQPRIERKTEYCPRKENSKALSSTACQHAAAVQAYQSGSSESASYCHIEESWPDDDDDNGEALLNEEYGGSKSAEPAAKHAPKGQQEVSVAQKGGRSVAQARKQSRDTQSRAGAKTNSGNCKGKRFACQKASLQRRETANKKVSELFVLVRKDNVTFQDLQGPTLSSLLLSKVFALNCIHCLLVTLMPSLSDHGEGET